MATGVTDARRTLNAFEQWCVKSNVQRIKDEELDVNVVVRTIRANGYPRVAIAVEDALTGKEQS